MLHNGKMIRMQILWKLCWKLSFASKEVITNFDSSCSNPRILNNGKEKTEWLSSTRLFMLVTFFSTLFPDKYIFQRFAWCWSSSPPHISKVWSHRSRESECRIKNTLTKLQQRTSATQFSMMMNLRLCNNFFGEFGFCNNYLFFGLSRTFLSAEVAVKALFANIAGHFQSNSHQVLCFWLSISMFQTQFVSFF